MKNGKKLLEAVQVNTFMVALSTYHRAVNEINIVNGSVCSDVLDSNELVYKNYKQALRGLRGSMVDALSYLAWLYTSNSIPEHCKYTIEHIFKEDMKHKELRKIINHACKRSKKGALYMLKKQLKKKRKK